MKYCRLTIVLLMVLLWGSISGGCSQDYTGVWYGLNEDSTYYDRETNDYISKLILKEDGTCSGAPINSGTYYISDEILFLEPTDGYLRELTISNRKDGAAALNFVDSGSGAVLIDDAGDEWDPYIVLYYPTMEMWEDAWEKFEEQRTEQLKELLISDIWFSENQELSEDYVNPVYDIYEFDGSTIYYSLGAFDEVNGSFYYCTNEELVELEDSWNYEIIDSHTINISDAETGKTEDVYCSASTVYDIDREYQSLYIGESRKFDNFENTSCVKVSDYDDWMNQSQ